MEDAQLAALLVKHIQVMDSARVSCAFGRLLLQRSKYPTRDPRPWGGRMLLSLESGLVTVNYWIRPARRYLGRPECAPLLWKHYESCTLRGIRRLRVLALELKEEALLRAMADALAPVRRGLLYRRLARKGIREGSWRQHANVVREEVERARREAL